MQYGITIENSHLLYIATSDSLQNNAHYNGGLAVFKVGYTTKPNLRIRGMRGNLDGIRLFDVDDWIIAPVLCGKEEIILIEKKIHKELENYEEFFVPSKDIGKTIGSGYSEVYCIAEDKKSGFFRKYQSSKNLEFRSVVLAVRQKFNLIGTVRVEPKNVVGYKEDSKRR